MQLMGLAAEAGKHEVKLDGLVATIQARTAVLVAQRGWPFTAAAAVLDSATAVLHDIDNGQAPSPEVIVKLRRQPTLLERQAADHLELNNKDGQYSVVIAQLREGPTANELHDATTLQNLRRLSLPVSSDTLCRRQHSVAVIACEHFIISSLTSPSYMLIHDRACIFMC